jgi:hypothetical protein
MLQVPQQSGDDCGIYVLYFIYCFLVIEELGEDLSNLVCHPFQTFMESSCLCLSSVLLILSSLADFILRMPYSIQRS